MAAGTSAGRAVVTAEVPASIGDRHRSTNSPTLAVDPTDRRFVVLADRLDAPAYGCGLEVSGDAGRSWVSSAPVLKLPVLADRCYAPEVAFDRTGRLYYLFVGLHGRGNTPMGVFVTTTDDRARSFSAPRQVLGPNAFGVRMAIDPAIGHRGRMHLVWLQAGTDPPIGSLPSAPNPILTAYSDDGGRTFSRRLQLNDPQRQRVVAPVLALGPDHAVHVGFYDLGADAIDYQGLEGPTWDGHWALLVSSSGDGGRHFRSAVVVDDRIVPPDRVILIFTMPPAALAAGDHGRVFAAWPDARHGDPDVVFRRSRNGGRQWDRPVRLNDDRVGNGRTQGLPRLAVAPGGRLDVVFYDRRDDPADVRTDVRYAYSSDDGATFAPSLRVDSHSSDTRIGISYVHAASQGHAEFGSRLGLLPDRTGAVVAWTDTRNAVFATQQEVFSARVDHAAPTRSGASTVGLWQVGACFVVIILGLFGFVRARYATNRRRDRTAAITGRSKS